VAASQEGDRDCRGRRLGSKCWWDAGSGNHGYLTTNQIGRQGRQSIVLALRPTVFDRDVPALDVAGLVQTLPEAGQTDIGVGLGRAGAEIADHRHRLLLRVQRRRRGHRAAEQQHQLAAVHYSMTSSARERIDGGRSGRAPWRS
jgi:hypothetical protein